MQLLTTNTKLSKGDKYLVAGLALAPHRRSGWDVCPEAGVCSSLCSLWFSGRTVTRPVREAMLRRTAFLFENPIGFRNQLHREIELWVSKARRLGVQMLLRLNVASDLDWTDVIRNHPEVTAYDYSKVRSRLEHGLPNYHVTYSWNERSQPADVNYPGNIAVVFNSTYHPQSGKYGPLPSTWRGRRVVDGDRHDYRIPAEDGTGVCVGLRYKGLKRNRQPGLDKGFIQ